VPVEPLPTLVQLRRRLATELLMNAARHSAIVDEVHDLEHVREDRGWTNAEAARYAELRELRAEARHRHDVAARDLRRLMSGARVW